MTPQEIVDLQVRRYMEGYAQCLRDLENDWHAVANPGARNRETYAELEKRRWGPNGRAHFGDPRPGDRPGRGTPEPWERGRDAYRHLRSVGGAA